MTSPPTTGPDHPQIASGSPAGVDEMVVDKTGVDDLGCYQKRALSLLHTYAFSCLPRSFLGNYMIESW